MAQLVLKNIFINMPKLEEKTKNFFDTIKKTVSNKEPECINAKEAYMVSKYGKALTEEDLFKETIKRINDAIKVKSLNSSEFALITSIKSELTNRCQEICSYYESLGYSVQLIDKDTKINNKILKGLITPMIIIAWGEYSF